MKLFILLMILMLSGCIVQKKTLEGKFDEKLEEGIVVKYQLFTW